MFLLRFHLTSKKLICERRTLDVSYIYRLNFPHTTFQNELFLAGIAESAKVNDGIEKKAIDSKDTSA